MSNDDAQATILQKFGGPITVLSREHLCFHEAGHAYVSLLCGIIPMGLHVGRDFPFNAVLHGGEPGSEEAISLGGLSCEMRLAELGCLAKSDGTIIGFDAIRHHAVDAAFADIRLWAAARADRLQSDDPPLAGWTEGLFVECMRMSRLLDMAAISRLVVALADRRWIDGEEIATLIGLPDDAVKLSLSAHFSTELTDAAR